MLEQCMLDGQFDVVQKHITAMNSRPGAPPAVRTAVDGAN